MVDQVKLRNHALVVTKAFTNIINKTFRTNMPVPKISFDVRGTTAGLAVYAEHRVGLNHQLYMENPTYFFNQTIPHEVAHLAAVWIHGRKGHGHGREWKVIMGLIGREPTRCHNLDVTNVKWGR